MTRAEFMEKHKDAAECFIHGVTQRVAVQYRRVVSTHPLTLDNRAFGLEPDGEEVELLPHHIGEWLGESAT